jgi:hypothetical protein
MVGESAARKRHSKGWPLAATCLNLHYRQHEIYSNCSPGNPVDAAALNIFIEKEARLVMYRLKCLGRLKNSRTGLSLIYDKMNKESPIIAAKTDITNHTNVFDRRYIVNFLPSGNSG